MGMSLDGLSNWQAETEGIDLLSTTIGDLLDKRARELPEQEAIVYSCYPEYGDMLNLRWSYREYQQRANIMAKGLLALGLHKGAHIAIWAANIPEWPILLMAAAKAGLVVVTINPLLQASEVEYILKQGDVQLLFFMARVRNYDHLATIQSLVTPGTHHGEVSGERLPRLRYVCLVGMTLPEQFELQAWRPAQISEVSELGMSISDMELASRQESISPTDAVALIYTSGTTGFPKGALLTHNNLLNDAECTGERVAVFAQRMELPRHMIRTCNTFPFFHVSGLIGLLTQLYYGGATHPVLNFDPLKTIQIISQEGCQCYVGVTTMILAQLQHADLASYNLSCLKVVITGGAPISLPIVEQVKARLGADIFICFGQTESSSSVTTTLLDDPFELRTSTVGKALPYMDIQIIDPLTGEVVPVGARGELCARGPLVMQGYYKMEEKTAETIDSGGWLHTGDLATMNAQGYVNIVGRLKDMVIRGGENLFPQEIEAFLSGHPKISDVYIVGVPDAYFGEELLAVVQPVEGSQLTAQEVRDFCKGQISHQKIPRYIQFVQSYPMTASGKVQKFVLRERAIRDLGLEESAQAENIIIDGI